MIPLPDLCWRHATEREARALDACTWADEASLANRERLCWRHWSEDSPGPYIHIRANLYPCFYLGIRANVGTFGDPRAGFYTGPLFYDDQRPYGGPGSYLHTWPYERACANFHRVFYLG
jgi:hypothetical protein